MATSVRIKLDHDGIQELLNCPEMSQVCADAAQMISDVAGDGFEVGEERHGSRVWFTVYTESEEAKVAEAEDHALSRAVSACRL